MTINLKLDYVRQLKADALDNIESYQDPDMPDALSVYTNSMKKALLADPAMVNTLPEYLIVALYGNVRFPQQVHTQWQQWLADDIQPNWDQFKVSIAFNNEDISLIKAIKEQSESLLIQSCAALFEMMILDPQQADPKTSDDTDNEQDDYDDMDSEYYTDEYDADGEY
ncbi:MAG: hypothetical protein ACPGUD_06705 [Parashewanella sp.]